MNEKILISYIIPAYNAADTLERAVESITHTCNMEKCEILIVENGSTDYTNKINPSFIFWNLENSAESWAEEILNIKENINRVSQKEIVDNFTMRGYEIHTEAKKLEKILLNGVVNK